MQAASRALLRFVLLGLLLAGASRAAETQDAVTISVEDAVAGIGESAQVVAKIVPRAGFLIAENYGNRVMQLTAADDAVEFPNKVVRGKMQDGALLFRVAVVPKQPGPHYINGVLRFAFVSESEGQRRLDIKWAPLTATVTGRP